LTERNGNKLKVVLSAQLTNLKSKSDRTWEVKLITQELDGNVVGKLTQELMNQVFVVIMSEDSVNSENIDV
jgi:hypothetical protein